MSEHIEPPERRVREAKPSGSKHWHEFKRWNRDPDFWRDVYNKVVSAFIIAAIGYLLGIAAGYIKPRQRAVYGIAGFLLVMVAVQRGGAALVNWVNGSEKRLVIAWRVVFILTPILGALAILQAWTGWP